MNKIQKFIIFSIIIFAMVGLTYFSVSKKSNAAVTATFSLSPASGSYEVGETFSVNIALDTGGNASDAAQVKYINYDPSLLEVQDASSSQTGVQIQAGSLYTNTLVNSVSGGTINLEQTTSGGTTYNGSGTFGTINFRVLAVGTAAITVDFTAGGTTATYVTGEEGGEIVNVLSSVSGASFTLTQPVDSTAPTISSVSSSSVTTSGASIAWSTNESSTSQVEYGTTTNYGSSTTLDSNMTTSHSASISSLSSGTMYHYRVKSQDAAGNLATSEDYTFTTSTPADTTAPIISGVSVSAKDQSAAVIVWTTNEDSTSQVEYGATVNYGTSTTLDSNQVTSHQVSIGSLTANTTYHYRVISKDSTGNEAKSDDATFVTDNSSTPPANDTTAPAAIKDLTTAEINDTSVILTWTAVGDDDSTGTASEYEVRYNTANITTKNWSKSTKVEGVTKPSASGTKEKLTVKKLKAETKYYFAIKVSDEKPNTSALSNILSATTKKVGESGDTTPPGKISNLNSSANAGQKSITISWANPKDDDLVKVLLVRNEKREPTSVNDGTLVYEGTGTSFIDKNIVLNTKYYYKIFAADEVPNYSEGASVSVSASEDIKGAVSGSLVVKNFKIESEDKKVKLSWTNPTADNFDKVVVRRKENIPPKNVSDGTLIYEGKEEKTIDSNVSVGKTYSYSIFAKDKDANYSKPVSMTVAIKSSAVNFVLGLIIALLLIVGGVSYWIFFRKNKPQISKDDPNKPL